MKLITLAFVFCLAAVAQDNPEFTGWMKSTKAAMDALSKNEKKTGPEATASAEKLASVYEHMIAFWRQKEAADAVKVSEEGKAAAAMLMSAANANDSEKAMAALKTIGGTCKPCHEAHREKSEDGKYRIK